MLQLLKSFAQGSILALLLLELLAQQNSLAFKFLEAEVNGKPCLPN